MKLILDPSGSETVLVGIWDGKVLNYQAYSSQERSIVGHVSTFLKKQKTTLAQCSAVYVVTGPGRYSNLRAVAVFANTIASQNKIALYATQTFVEPDPEKKLRAILKKAKRVTKIEPFYGKPPHITKPKKRVRS